MLVDITLMMGTVPLTETKRGVPLHVYANTAWLTAPLQLEAFRAGWPTHLVVNLLGVTTRSPILDPHDVRFSDIVTIANDRALISFHAT